MSQKKLLVFGPLGPSEASVRANTPSLSFLDGYEIELVDSARFLIDEFQGVLSSWKETLGDLSQYQAIVGFSFGGVLALHVRGERPIPCMLISSPVRPKQRLSTILERAMKDLEADQIKEGLSYLYSHVLENPYVLDDSIDLNEAKSRFLWGLKFLFTHPNYDTQIHHLHQLVGSKSKLVQLEDVFEHASLTVIDHAGMKMFEDNPEDVKTSLVQWLS